MRYPWKVVAWAGCVALALALPARADTDGVQPPTDKERIAQLEKQVQQLDEMLRLTRQKTDLLLELRARDNDDLKAQLKDISSRLETLTRDQRRAFSFDPTSDDVKTRLQRIEDRLDSLMKDRRSFSIDPQTPTTGTGNIVLRNRLNVSGTVILNGVVYRLVPGETRTVTGVRAGDFTYEAMADGMGTLQPLVTRNLRPNFSFEIDLIPR